MTHVGVTNSNKEITVSKIECGGSFNVRLALTAEPDITENPADIVLILDRSGSMRGSPLENLKIGANAFIDIIDEATDSTKDGQIGSGSRIGIVSFSSTATQDTQLITSVSDLKDAVDSLTADGSTNHADAFTKAMELFDDTSDNAKIMIMFTDGVTTTGGNPNDVATQAKAQGVIMYSIGLLGDGGVDEQTLRDWASDPDSAYVIIAPDEQELEELFEDLAKNIVKPGATNVVITDKVNECFRITSVETPTKGTTQLLDENTVEWKIDELGVTQSEGAVLEFTVEHVGGCSGNVEVNESITYSDDEGNVVVFPSPEIEIDCGEEYCAESCSVPVDIETEGCKETTVFDAGELEMEALGRIVQIDVTLKNVCPDKRVALAVMLYELDDEDNEYRRGIKFITVPAHSRPECTDITVKCIQFVLPEESDVSDVSERMCDVRRFRARFLKNYIDGEFSCNCCNAEE